MCCCAIGCQHSTLNRLFGSWFGCVFLVWRHHLRIIGAHFHAFFSTIFLFLTFLNIHICFIILKTYDQQFTLTTKKSLHIIFNVLKNKDQHQCIGCRLRIHVIYLTVLKMMPKQTLWMLCLTCLRCKSVVFWHARLHKSYSNGQLAVQSSWTAAVERNGCK